MKKPSNRKERIEFIDKKYGNDFARSFYKSTDKEVKEFVNLRYTALKNKEDYVYETPVSTCIRCGEEVLHHQECGCGIDRAVFDNYGWKDDIESNSDRIEGDEEFIANGYKSDKAYD